jgi:hypothetical protein
MDTPNATEGATLDRGFTFFTKEEVCAVGGLMASLAEGNIAIQRPEWENPTYWSRPMITTKSRCLSRSASSWRTFLSISGRAQYVGVVRWLVMETLLPREDTGVDFRVRMSSSSSRESFAPAVNFEDARVSLNKDPVDIWPLNKRSFFCILRPTDTLEIQVRNTIFKDEFLFTGIFGHYYESVDANEMSSGRETGGGLIRVAR